MATTSGVGGSTSNSNPLNTTSNALNSSGTSSASSTNDSSSAVASAIGQQLGQDAFLKLLMTQLKYQDPMQPMDNTQFVSQMAQFSSLEQMQNLNTNISSQEGFTQLTQASGLIGKTVDIQPDSGDAFTGKVTEIRKVNGNLNVMVQKLDSNGAPTSDPPQAYDLSTIQQVS